MTDLNAVPWWAWIALVNLVAVVAVLVRTHDELQFDETPRWFAWPIQGILILIAITVGAPLVFWLCIAEWRVRQRTAEVEARRP